MTRYIFRRLLGAIPVLLIIITITFFHDAAAPGGPFSRDRVLPQEVGESDRGALPPRRPALETDLIT